MRIALGCAVQAAERFSIGVASAADCQPAIRCQLAGSGVSAVHWVILVRKAGKTVPNAIAKIREVVDFLRYYAQQSATVSLEQVCPAGRGGLH
ncbi:MAG: hypothetical protein ACR5LD_02235 [Symbiopectobacterium sp.]